MVADRWTGWPESQAAISFHSFLHLLLYFFFAHPSLLLSDIPWAEVHESGGLRTESVPTWPKITIADCVRNRPLPCLNIAPCRFWHLLWPCESSIYINANVIWMPFLVPIHPYEWSCSHVRDIQGRLILFRYIVYSSSMIPRKSGEFPITDPLFHWYSVYLGSSYLLTGCKTFETWKTWKLQILQFLVSRFPSIQLYGSAIGSAW